MNPLSIYQQALDTVSNAVLSGEFETYAAQIDLPYLIHTENARLLVTTVEDLRPTFDTLSRGLAARGVTHYERVAHEADYVSRDRIEGWHLSNMIADGERIAYPQVSRHAIVRRDGAWLFSEAHYAIKADRWPLTDAVIFADAGRPVADRGLT